MAEEAKDRSGRRSEDSGLIDLKSILSEMDDDPKGNSGAEGRTADASGVRLAADPAAELPSAPRLAPEPRAKASSPGARAESDPRKDEVAQLRSPAATTAPASAMPVLPAPHPAAPSSPVLPPASAAPAVATAAKDSQRSPLAESAVPVSSSRRPLASPSASNLRVLSESEVEARKAIEEAESRFPTDVAILSRPSPVPTPWVVKPAKRLSTRLLPLVLAIGVLGGGALGLRHWTRAQPAVAASAPTPTAVAPSSTSPTAQAAPDTNGASATGTGAADLPGAPEPSVLTNANVGAVRANVATVRGAGHPAPAPAPAPADSTTKLDVKEGATAPTGEGQDFGEALRSAVGARADAPKKEATEGSSEKRATLRPSPGAVTGAVNGVLPAARVCLGPDAAIVPATVTFDGNGVGVARVKRTPANAFAATCIEEALSKARIEPFVEAPYTINVTVRP